MPSWAGPEVISQKIELAPQKYMDWEYGTSCFLKEVQMLPLFEKKKKKILGSNKIENSYHKMNPCINALKMSSFWICIS